MEVFRKKRKAFTPFVDWSFGGLNFNRGVEDYNLNEDYYKGKKDNGKTRWDLLPMETVEKIAEILTFGAAKYGANNWQTVPDARPRYEAAMMRHYVAYLKGEKQDAESGINPLYHAFCNMMFLVWFEMHEGEK